MSYIATSIIISINENLITSINVAYARGLTSKGFTIYLAKRSLGLTLAVIIVVYITIYIANIGGFVDEMIIREIEFMVSESLRNDPAYAHLPPSEIRKLISEVVELEVKRLGLDQPFLVRSFNHLKEALTLNLGRAYFLVSDSGSRAVRDIIAERLPTTILLFTTANILIFVSGLILGLVATRRYGGKVDKLIVSLSPLSAIPGWFYGIFLIMVFASFLRVLPYGGLVDAPPPEDWVGYVLSVMRHMILPITAWLISYVMIEAYIKRTFFLIFSKEDYVELAKAKGLDPRTIERRYILLPVLPPILTSFSLTTISSWLGAVVTEVVFNWPGLGLTLYNAALLLDAPVIVGSVVIYAYLLAATLLVLEISYAIIDPRIRSGSGDWGA